MGLCFIAVRLRGQNLFLVWGSFRILSWLQSGKDMSCLLRIFIEGA